MLFREKKNRLFIGMELNNTSAQLSFLHSDRPEPETVSLVAGQEQYAIPMALCKCYGVNQWYFGKDAWRHGEEKDGTLVEGLLEKACAGEQITLEEEQFDAVSLLALFVRRCISVMLLGTAAERPDYLMLTVEKLDKRMIEVLSGVGDYLQMDRDHLFFQSHAESFYEYCMHQPEELRTHEVLICEYASKHMKAYRLEFNRRTSPIVAFIEEKEFPQMSFPPISEEGTHSLAQARQRDQKFIEIIHDLTDERIVSCVYLIGDGYQGDWCKESLRLLCSKRRVFQGNNLYSKGACYAAYERVHKGDISEKYIFLGKDRIKVNIGIQAVLNGKEQYVPLIDAGMNWFDIDRGWDFILESGREISFVLTPLSGGQKKRLVIDLDDFPDRPENATRLHARIRFLSENSFEVRIEDRGFGEFFASSGRSWEEKVEL